MTAESNKETCCTCGRDLPNRYAVAGRCEEKGCTQPFCTLHWHRGNRRCPEHGGQERNPTSVSVAGQEMPSKRPEQTGEPMMNAPDSDNKAKPADPSRAKKVMQDTLSLFKKMGLGAVELLKRLKKDKSPQAMLKTIEESLQNNQTRREALSVKLEEQFKHIAVKKKAYETAPPARKRILEAELKSLLATYQAGERELGVLLENERTLAQVKGRMHEIMAYGMAGVTDVSIDNLIDDLEEKVGEAEGRVDALRDLEKAGKRRERESDQDSFLEQLGGFETTAAETVAQAGEEGAERQPRTAASEQPTSDEPEAAKDE